MGRRTSKAARFAFSLCSTIFLSYIPLALANPQQQTQHAAAKKIPIYTARQSASDLTVTGLIAGLPGGVNGYVHYADLARLPQVTIEIHGDENFREIDEQHGIRATGIYLDVLAHAMGALPISDLMDATCTDDYRSHFPASYIAAHHPIFVIAINHLSTSEWARRAHKYDPGPYFITHDHFAPSFQVLSHQDKPQVPSGITRLNFSTIAATYGAIAPRGHFAADSKQEHGFIIARQNCLRCHNQGQYGGVKAGRTWTTLSTWAREQPAYFENYVSNPKAFEPHAKMPGNPSYDKQTLEALDAYFRTFTESPETSSQTE